MDKKKSTPKSSVKKDKATPKSAKKSTGKASEKRGEYVYTKLSEFLKEEKQRVYFYASILDSSAPYYHSGVEKYICTLKVIDDTVNPDDLVGGKPGHLQLTVFANAKAEVPANVKMGQIIRVHRGDTKKYGKSIQLNCDTGIKAAWCVFDANEGFAPIVHTGANYSHLDEDGKKKLNDLRKFCKKFFKDVDVTKASSAGAKKGEIDMFAQVMEIKTSEGDKTHCKVTVFDGEEFHKLKVIKGAFPNIAPKDIVRVRGTQKKGGEFIFNDYTNMIKIDPTYEAAKVLLAKIEKGLKKKEVSEKYESYVSTPGKAHIVTEVLDEKPLSISLKKLFNYDNAKAKEKKFRINVHPLEIVPKDVKSWVLTADAKTKKQYSLPDGAQYYKLQIYVKDATDTSDTNIYSIYLCTVDGKGEEFLPTLGKAKKGEKEGADLKKAYKILTRASSTLDLIVEGVAVSGGSPIFFIVDSKLKI